MSGSDVLLAAWNWKEFKEWGLERRASVRSLGAPARVTRAHSRPGLCWPLRASARADTTRTSHGSDFAELAARPALRKGLCVPDAI